MDSIDWMHDVLASDLNPEVKLVLYELFPYFVACPSLRRLVLNGGCEVYDIHQGGSLAGDSSAASVG